MFKKPKAKEPQLGATVIRDRDPEQSWETLNKLGDGAFAVVYRAKHKSQENKFSALKLVEDMKTIEESEMMLVMLEIEILSRCKHDFVLGLDEAYIYHDKLYMYLELCSGGGLDSIMQELQKVSYFCIWNIWIITNYDIKYHLHDVLENLLKVSIEENEKKLALLPKKS